MYFSTLILNRGNEVDQAIPRTRKGAANWLVKMDSSARPCLRCDHTELQMMGLKQVEYSRRNTHLGVQSKCDP
jgi:hypothetical protein